MFRRLLIASLLALALLPTTAKAKTGIATPDSGRIALEDQDQKARESLANKLDSLARSLSLREAKLDAPMGNDGKTNADDGNAFASNTTYHSTVWDYCEKWLGPTTCNKWTPKFVSQHGKEGDRSPVEGYVWDQHLARAGDGQIPDAKGEATWSVFKFRTRNSAPLKDQYGKLNQDQIVEMSLLPDVQQGIRKIADNTVGADIKSMQEAPPKAAKAPSAKEPGFVPPETLRYMSRNLARMFRNRMIDIVGDVDAMAKGIEMPLAEDRPDCEAALDAIRKEQDRVASMGGKKISAQAQLEQETRNKTLEDRYNLCVKMRQVAAATVNPKVVGKEIQAGSAKNETITRAFARVNLALVDSVGSDPNEFELPEGVQLKKDQYTQEMSAYDESGDEVEKAYRTNAEQLAKYNKAVLEAAGAMKDINSRAPMIRDTSSEIAKFQIQPKTMNMIRINGLTPDQRTEFVGTKVEKLADPSKSGGPNPEMELESKSAELTVTRR